MASPIVSIPPPSSYRPGPHSRREAEANPRVGATAHGPAVRSCDFTRREAALRRRPPRSAQGGEEPPGGCGADDQPSGADPEAEEEHRGDGGDRDRGGPRERVGPEPDGDDRHEG